MYRHKNKNINIDVDCDFIITKEVYTLVVESLLKYVLYQFHQIPVQVDILEKEWEKWSKSVSDRNNQEADLQSNHTTSINDISEENIDPRDFIRKMANERRAQIAKRNYERKRNRWFKKVETVIKNYRSTLNILKREIEKGVVTSILFAIGTTPLTAKYVVKIIIPNQEVLNYMTNSSVQSSATSIKRKVLYTMFKAFAGSSDLSVFTNSSFSSSKLWTMFEKESDFSKDEDCLCEESIIARPEFEVAPRAKVVEVHLNGMKPPLSLLNIDMDLTPCVGVCTNNFKTPFVKSNLKSVNGKNSFVIPLFTQRKKIDGEEYGDMGLSPLDYSMDEDINGDKQTSFIAPLLPTPLKRISLIGFSETPQRCKGSDLMIETPVVSKLMATPSPIKKLARSISKCEVTPTLISNKESLWYQIYQSISGLKDVYLESVK